jgi:hypothetical protein
MNRIFGMLGLKLTVAQAIRDSSPAAIQTRVRGGDGDGEDSSP